MRRGGLCPAILIVSATLTAEEVRTPRNVSVAMEKEAISVRGFDEILGVITTALR
jgi:hypothetical protein